MAVSRRKAGYDRSAIGNHKLHRLGIYRLGLADKSWFNFSAILFLDKQHTFLYDDASYRRHVIRGTTHFTWGKRMEIWA